MKVTEHSWNSEPEVGNLISALIDIHSCKEVLEVGVFKGATALSMMKVNYTGIDIEDFREEPVKEAMKGHKFIIGNSITELKKLPEKNYDFIFIDSVHEFNHCIQEFKMCESLIKKGGLICFHDSIKFPGVAKVIEYIKSFNHFEVVTLNSPFYNGFSIVKCY